MKGYNALRESAAWREIPGRGKIRMTGEDRLRLLHAMTTNHVQQLTPGSGCYAFFLTEKGRILSGVNIFSLPDAVLLDSEPETVQVVYDHLDKYIIADDVTLENLTTQLATIQLEGPQAGAALTALGAPLPQTDYDHQEWGVRRVVRLGETSFLIFTPEADKDALVQSMANVQEADAEAFHIVRLEHGRARYGEDIRDRFLAQEANQPHAVHYQKGCYLGQEIVERVRSRGQVHRMLVPIEMDTTQPPPAGTKFPWGEITSSAYSPALGKVVALAYVRTELTQPGVQLAPSDIPARVRPL